MNIKQRVSKYCEFRNIAISKFEQLSGLSNGYFNNIKKRPSSEKIESIHRTFPDLNTAWLLTGEGEMLKPVETNAVSESDARYYSGKGAPYYNVDFTANFSLMQNDQTTVPDGMVSLPQFKGADCWVNVSGKSMEPTISSGDMIALRKVENWTENILYGEVYAIVTEQYRTIKRIRKSEDPDMVRLVPDNTEYDAQDIRKESIIAVFRVLGAAKVIY